MKIVDLPVPFQADWFRSIILNKWGDYPGGVKLQVTDEEEQRWEVRFQTVQAFRFTTEECAMTILSSLPHQGAAFEVLDSPWIIALGLGRVRFLDSSRHFVICCYDEIVEFVAWNYEIEPLAGPEVPA